MKHLLGIAFILVSVALFSYLRIDGVLLTSFLISTLVLFGILTYHLYIERSYSPFLSAYIVFNFLFFIVAPLTQISILEQTPSPEFVNKFPYKKDLILQANVLIILFNISFIAVYAFLKRFKPLRKASVLSNESLKILPLTIVILLVISILVFLMSIDFVQYEISRPSWQKSEISVFAMLVWTKVLFLTPFAGVILCFQYFRKKYKKPLNYAIIITFLFVFLLLLFWFKNPLIEKRNALGPIYICLMIIFLPKLLNSNTKMLGFLFLTMIVAFPLTAVFTHTDASFSEILKSPAILFEETNKGGGIVTAFNTLNYDAFANILATIEYVGEYGFAMGGQLLSAFLFFVPRSVWSSKPVSTGELVGDHLIDRYDFTYSNLSNPMVSEGYINYGILGVILGAIFLAFVTVKFMSWLRSNDDLKRILAYYLAIHFIFLLRGDFTNGYSYFIGTVIGVLLIPKSIEFLIKHILRYQKRWALSTE